MLLLFITLDFTTSLKHLELYGFYIQYHLEEAQEFDTSTLFDANLFFDKFSFHYKSFSKFKNDKVFSENTDYIIGLDGVLLNLSLLKKTQGISDIFGLIIHLFSKQGVQFVANLKGEFSGFIFEKKTKKLHVFNNKKATKQVFYTQHNKGFAVAPTVKALVNLRQSYNETNQLNTQAVYTMLSFGGMIEEQTLVDAIFKLGAAEILSFQDDTLKVDKYYDYNTIPYLYEQKDKAIDAFNSVFVDAVKAEYEKDKEYEYSHIATLSGGLDSRMTVMLADKLGYANHSFCFSQTGYADELIAQEIAQSLGIDFRFIPLDGGDYLKNLSKMVAINSGLQFYHGSAHFDFALQQLDLSKYGLIHTGQIGDGILGGFVSNETTHFLSKTISKRFLHKTAIDQTSFKAYRDEEIFKLYQRVFNLTNFGSYMVEQHKTYITSPFYDETVMEVALSIHPKLKLNQGIYIDWINKWHPEVTNYKWERTGFRPNRKWKTPLSRYTNKLKQEYYKITKQADRLSMNPLSFWLKNNLSIEQFYMDYYRDNRQYIADNSELHTDFSLLMQEGSFTEKALVLTLLEVIKTNKLKI